MIASDACWYVAYGSNMDPKALARYLPEGVEIRTSRKLVLDRALYYAGRSKTWGGSVAFLALAPESVQTPARAFLLDSPALAAIMSGENGQAITDSQVRAALADLAPGDHVQLPLPADLSGFRSKYDALLRLSDIDGIAAYTVTTAKELEAGDPAPEYYERIQQARLLP